MFSRQANEVNTFLSEQVTFGSDEMSGLEDQAMCTIYTHCDWFHCDEVLATGFVLYKHYLEKKEGTAVVRRVPHNLQPPWPFDAGTVYTIDIGRTYNPSERQFDHHQKGFNEKFYPEAKIHMSSAGEIWKHYGQELIQRHFESCNEHLLPKQIDAMHKHMYTHWIELVDLIDNRGPQAPSVCSECGSRSSLPIGQNSLSGLVGDFNDNTSPAASNEAFRQALLFVTQVMLNKLRGERARIEDMPMIQAGIDKRFSADSSGRIAVMERGSKFMADLVSSTPTNPPVDFVIYPVTDGYMVMKVGQIFLPSDWHGKDNEALVEAGAPANSYFCHKTGFIMGNKDASGALQAARMAIQPTTETRQAALEGFHLIAVHLDSKGPVVNLQDDPESCRIEFDVWPDSENLDDNATEIGEPTNYTIFFEDGKFKLHDLDWMANEETTEYDNTEDLLDALDKL